MGSSRGSSAFPGGLNASTHVGPTTLDTTAAHQVEAQRTTAGSQRTAGSMRTSQTAPFTGRPVLKTYRSEGADPSGFGHRSGIPRVGKLGKLGPGPLGKAPGSSRGHQFFQGSRSMYF